MDVWELGMHAWELTILRIVDALQSTKEMVTTTDIYEALEQGTFKELTEQDLRKPTELGGKPAYQYIVLTYLSSWPERRNLTWTECHGGFTASPKRGRGE
jgi:hypothetical protein